MTHEELRAKAIWVIEKAIWAKKHLGNASDALDALGEAGFHVLGPQVSDEMMRAANELPHNTLRSGRFYAMVAAGDLTKKETSK